MGQRSAIAQSVVITALWGIGLSYYFVKSHATEIKKNWSARRCDPRVIPFAGIINAPPGADVGLHSSKPRGVSETVWGRCRTRGHCPRTLSSFRARQHYEASWQQHSRGSPGREWHPRVHAEDHEHGNDPNLQYCTANCGDRYNNEEQSQQGSSRDGNWYACRPGGNRHG